IWALVSASLAARWVPSAIAWNPLRYHAKGSRRRSSRLSGRGRLGAGTARIASTAAVCSSPKARRLSRAALEDSSISSPTTRSLAWVKADTASSTLPGTLANDSGIIPSNWQLVVITLLLLRLRTFENLVLPFGLTGVRLTRRVTLSRYFNASRYQDINY